MLEKEILVFVLKMDNLEKIKNKRASIRSSITKFITIHETLLEAYIAKTNLDSLLESLELLNEKK